MEILADVHLFDRAAARLDHGAGLGRQRGVQDDRRAAGRQPFADLGEADDMQLAVGDIAAVMRQSLDDGGCRPARDRHRLKAVPFDFFPWRSAARPCAGRLPLDLLHPIAQPSRYRLRAAGGGRRAQVFGQGGAHLFSQPEPLDLALDPVAVGLRDIGRAGRLAAIGYAGGCRRLPGGDFLQPYCQVLAERHRLVDHHQPIDGIGHTGAPLRHRLRKAGGGHRQHLRAQRLLLMVQPQAGLYVGDLVLAEPVRPEPVQLFGPLFGEGVFERPARRLEAVQSALLAVLAVGAAYGRLRPVTFPGDCRHQTQLPARRGRLLLPRLQLVRRCRPAPVVKQVVHIGPIVIDRLVRRAHQSDRHPRIPGRVDEPADGRALAHAGRDDRRHRRYFIDISYPSDSRYRLSGVPGMGAGGVDLPLALGHPRQIVSHRPADLRRRTLDRHGLRRQRREQAGRLPRPVPRLGARSPAEAGSDQRGGHDRSPRSRSHIQ